MNPLTSCHVPLLLESYFLVEYDSPNLSGALGFGQIEIQENLVDSGIVNHMSLVG
jgi:hypothetical protein